MALDTLVTSTTTEPASDVELVERFRAGDKEAFGELYGRYFSKLEGYVRRRFPYLDAEDVVQSSFTNSIRGIDSYDSSREFAGWIHAITLNQARRMSLRRMKTQSKERQLEDIGSYFIAETEDPLTRLESREERVRRRLEGRFVKKIMREVLSDRHLEALRLIYLEGLSYKDAAREIGVSGANMKVMMYRMKKRVMNALQEEGYKFQNGN